MIPNRSILAVAVFILAIGILPAYAASPFNPQDEALSKRQFLAAVKRLVDSGSLSDAEAVSRILGLKFTHVDKVLQPKVADCSAVNYAHNEYSNNREFSVQGANWYRVTPFGRKDVQIRGAINEQVQENLTRYVAPKKQPVISYNVFHSRLCGDDHHEYLDARLDFNDLPVFLCISYADVQAAMPAAEFARGIHFVETLYYKAPASEESAVDMRFGPYLDGSQCMVDIEISENSARGLRFQRIHPWKPPQQ